MHVTAIEHETIAIAPEGSEFALSSAEAEILTGLGEDRPGFCERGYRSLRLAQYCGVVNLGPRVLEILPKVGSEPSAPVGRSVLLRLLRASGRLDGHRVSPADQRLERSPLLDVFTAAFLESVAGLVRRGLLRQYHEREEDLTVVRGRIVFSRQFGVHFNRPDTIASRYDELTVDNVWNQFVKAALRVCRRWIVSGDLRRRWVELFAAFEEVSDVTPDVSELDRLVYDRHATRYRQAMRWVRWILSLLSPAMRAGPESAPAFLFNMNAVFEDVVSQVFKRYLDSRAPWLSVSEAKGRKSLARLADAPNRKAFRLRPDVLVGDPTGVRMIVDAKWKRVAVTGSGHLRPTRDDMYQMHAYAAAFGVDHLALVYPLNDESRHAKPTTFLLANGARVSVLAVDIEKNDLPLVGHVGLLSEPSATSGL